MEKQNKDTLRRNLSGIYIFDTLPQDKHRKPTCIEDCSAQTRLKWLNSLDNDALKAGARHLNECFCKLWKMLSPEEQNALEENFHGTPFCDIHSTADLNVQEINRFCEIFRYVADMASIYAKGSEADPDYKDED